MNWIVFLLAAYVMTLIDVGLGSSVLQIGGNGYVPVLGLILLAYVGLFAPTFSVVGAAFVLGLLADLATSVPGGASTVLGPHVLGYLMASYLVMQLRGVLVRESIPTLAMSTLLGGVLSVLVVTIWLLLRKLIYGQMDEFRAVSWLATGVIESLYSAVVALVLGMPLFGAARWFGFAIRARVGRSH